MLDTHRNERVAGATGSVGPAARCEHCSEEAFRAPNIPVPPGEDTDIRILRGINRILLILGGTGLILGGICLILMFLPQVLDLVKQVKNALDNF